MTKTDSQGNKKSQLQLNQKSFHVKIPSDHFARLVWMDEVLMKWQLTVSLKGVELLKCQQTQSIIKLKYKLDFWYAH